MAFEFLKANGGTDNTFYREHTHHVIYAIAALVFTVIMAVITVLYEELNRPLPEFYAQNSEGKVINMVGYLTPNLMAPTILRWASKAAILAYTFGFRNYNEQIAAVRPYFTSDGWNDYQSSLSGVLSTIVARQLFTTAVVSGPPVISNQGFLSGSGYTWRVQVPLLVTYQSDTITTQRNFIVVITIVSVSTNINPQGIGIDQFIMVER